MGTAQCVQRFYIMAPTKDEHKHHTHLSAADIFSMDLNKVISQKIRDLVSQGIDSVREIKHILGDFITNTFKDFSTKPTIHKIHSPGFLPIRQDNCKPY